MADAFFKDLCIDANDPGRLGGFWSNVLGRKFDAGANDNVVLVGPTDQHRVWVNAVPEPKTVKNRVHLDVYTTELAALVQLGAEVELPEADGRGWTVMSDPEGNEFCAFLRAELPAELLHGLVVDCAEPALLAQWWGDAYGAEVVHHEQGYSTVQGVPGMPIATMDFVPVPEPKRVKNRVHWDVVVSAVEPLLVAGASMVRPQDGETAWHVLADPEGNEFCAFVR